ncbi:hypothetical protein [Alteribacter natronophilus]|uniref:hypothetical protein n=1 Tax=Alteribacter natronophilus TaxID=2583810 RepID=UPI00110D965E|nr:hypothetical protein [Alteribacter natronophilus]TMW73351.1 hypothetical protein FGB90_03325 [Alteribacter natronophilus]
MTWMALFRKEVRQNLFLMGLHGALLLAVFAFITYHVGRLNLSMIFIGIPLIAGHLIAVLIYIVASMRREWKERTALIWMNLPHSGFTLLSAKLAAAVFAGAMFLAVTMVSFGLILHTADSQLAVFAVDGLGELYVRYAGWLFAGIMFGSIQLALAGLFIFVINKVIRPFGWLVGIAVTFALSWLWSEFTDTQLYASVAHWGPMLRVEGIPDQFNIDLSDAHGSVNESGQTLEMIYLGHTLIELGLLAAVFYVICYLFDKKAEI